MSIRAAMYLPGLQPGSMSWTIYQDFAAGMRQQGMEFEVWTDTPADGAIETPGTRYLDARRGTTALDRLAAPWTRTTRLLETARRIAPHLRGPSAPDLLYVELAYPFGVGVDLARRLARSRIPLVVAPMGEDVLSVPAAAYGFSRYAVPRRLLRNTLSRCAAVRCISPLVVEYVSPYTAAPHPVIPLGVSSDTVAAAMRTPERLSSERAGCRSALVERFSLGDSPVIVALGRLHPFKGLDLLIDALPKIPDARLLIVGPTMSIKAYGDYARYLQHHAESRGLADRVILTGATPHSEVLEVMGGADVVVVPSLYESLNKVTVEAVAAGAPVVVTRTTGITTFFDEPGIGQAIEPGSAQAIADAVSAVLDGRWTPDRDAGRRFVSRFAPEVVGADLAELLREAARR